MSKSEKVHFHLWTYANFQKTEGKVPVPSRSPRFITIKNNFSTVFVRTKDNKKDQQQQQKPKRINNNKNNNNKSNKWRIYGLEDE